VISVAETPSGGWSRKAECEEDYNGYVKVVSGSRITMLSLFAGFTFSAITMHPNWLPDPSSLISQFILFFLVVLFDLCLFLLAWQVVIVVATYNVSYAPARAKWELVVFNLVLMAVFILWGWSVVLMFLVRNMYFLTLVSGVIWVAVIVMSIAVMRTSLKHLGWNIKEGLKYDGQGMEELKNIR
jgi:hypothetical protein